MEKTQRNTEVVPLDIRKIRQTVGLSNKQMGERIAVIAQGINNTPIPSTRIAEWEHGWRPIPDYVFNASAYILLDFWSDDRHLTPKDRQQDVDVYYSSALNRPLGELFKLERDLGRSRNVKLRHLAKQVRKARIAQMRYLESTLDVKMSYVFEDTPGPCRDVLDDAM